ncbi:MAG: hypothetical protein WHS63_12595 [Tenuifilum sp.]|uniref:hypothetical protein n=1 Tax=Tenuifilum sp. TaxID=2760880 RepID=UPI0030A56676
MACETRNQTGCCRHYQCPFAHVVGLECVEMVYVAGKLYCECGCDCVAECPHSYSHGTDEALIAEGAFEGYFIQCREQL